MKKRFLVLLLALAILSSYLVFSHETGEEMKSPDVYPVSQLAAVGYGSLAFGILIVIILLSYKKMSETAKKIVYIILVITVSVVTIYLIFVTLHLNLTSLTKGPVHWHADYEVWACDNQLKLASPKSMMSNEQGTSLLHSHKDDRIHVEGVLLDKKQASLSAFFSAVQGSLADDGFNLLTDNGIASFHDGDNCNGKPAKFYVFVNGKLISHPDDYIIAPYEKVPPGDRIKFVFTEKSIEEINPNIG